VKSLLQGEVVALTIFDFIIFKKPRNRSCTRASATCLTVVPFSLRTVTQVKSLMRGEVVALKGCCPNCGEEVYAFLEAKQQKPRHKSECHVCEHPLVFHATVEVGSIRFFVF
jgi:uncharacterized protein (DUF983 family)